MQPIITSAAKSLLYSKHSIFKQCLSALHEYQAGNEYGPHKLILLFYRACK